MRKPKEQVDEEGNEAHFFEEFESSDDVADSDDDSGTRDPRKPKKPARQRVELRSEQQSLAAAAVRLGRLRAGRLRHEAVVCRAAAATWRAYTHKFLRIRRCRERQAQAQTFCCATGLPGRLGFIVEQQPDDVTCGPACLHGLYRHYGDDVPLERVVADIHTLDKGGTLDVFLANHALKRGYDATILTYNLDLFDPTWFALPNDEIRARLAAQAKVKPWRRLQAATRGYDEFLRLGRQARAARPRSRRCCAKLCNAGRSSRA